MIIQVKNIAVEAGDNAGVKASIKVEENKSGELLDIIRNRLK